MRGITNINMVENPHQKQAHIPVFSRTFDEIPVYSRPGIIIIKFQYFPGFPGSVRTLLRGEGGWWLYGSVRITEYGPMLLALRWGRVAGVQFPDKNSM